MSRFGDDDDYDEWFPNQAAMWHANARRALKGKRGRRALAELREALLALPQQRLIEGALCTLQRSPTDMEDKWYREDLDHNVKHQGEGVCAIGAFLWHKKVKAGADPQEAFAELPTLLASDGDADYRTAELGRDAGLTFTLASSLAYRNDGSYEDKTPEERFKAFVAWIDAELAEGAAA